MPRPGVDSVTVQVDPEAGRAQDTSIMTADTSVSKRRPGSPRDLGLLIVCLLIVYAAAAIGAVASLNAPAFYASLTRPGWAPPSSVFGPVWTLLYSLMGIALWRVWRGPRGHAAAITLFLVQLALNASWSWLFFRWHLGAPAFAWIMLLLAMILATIVTFWRVSRVAAVLLVPYLGWVAFATVLSWSIWRANPALLG